MTRVVAFVALAALLAVVVPPQPAVAAGSALSLTGNGPAWAGVGSKRSGAIASVAVTVPGSLPVDVGWQFRSTSRSSGYRAEVSVATDGAVTGRIVRVRSGVATTLVGPTELGFRVSTGEAVRIEAAVVGTKPVWLYLRAWPALAAKPATWQLGVSDASSARFAASGKSYLRADATQPLRLAYAGASVGSYTASKAAAVGVAPPEPGPDTFGVAVIPDTQAETNNLANTPFLNRVNWMVANKARYDLRYVLHTGDMTNWGWLDAGQVTRARAAMDVIRYAGIPYDLAVGNHDTKAVGWNGIKGSTGYGGSAYMDNPECPARLTAAACKSWLLVRHTETFNTAFPLTSIDNLGGAFEAGRIDNNWATFTASGTSWLVLTLELWPRKEVVAWARDVVASHPNDNVIIQTHHYLNGNGGIATSNGGYGATSPKYLYDTVVAKYPNVKLVFSGHTGHFTMRSDSRNGNPVLSYLGNDLGGPSHNPVRVLSINARTGDVFTRVYDPITKRLVAATSNTIRVIG